MTPSQIKKQLAELKKRKIEVLGAIEAYKKTHYLEYFVPHAKQQPVFDAVQDRKVRTILYQGGNRSGKTTWLIATISSLLMGYFPWNKQLTRFPVPVKIRLCGEDNGHHLKEVLIPKLKEMIPASEIQFKKKNQQGLEAYWQLTNGSTLELMSYEQNTDIYEGWDGHVAAFDEPPPRDKYIACKRGLIDHNGIAIMSLTPLKEPWIYDEIVAKADDSIKVFKVNMRDNPHLNEKAIADFEKDLNDDEKETRLKGGWLFLQGLVYKKYDPSVHLIDPFDIPQSWPVYVAIDTHPRTKQALTFMAVDEKDRFYICHEVWEHGSPEDIGEWIVNYHRKVHKIEMGIIEPGSKGDTNRGQSTFDVIDDILAAENIVLETGSRDLAGGIRMVERAIMSPNGMPSLFCFNNCVRTHYEFTRYVWDDWKTTEKDPKQKPRDKDDHMMENVRRLIQHPVSFRSKMDFQRLLDMAQAQSYQPVDNIAGY